MTYREQMQQWRKRVGYSQQEVADLMGINRSTLAYLESGKTQPDAKKILQFCRIYHISTRRFLLFLAHTPRK